MDRPQFERKYGFRAAFDPKRKKRVSLAPHLANDKAYLEKHGFELIETPEPTQFKAEVPEMVTESPETVTELPEMVTEITETEKPKRGRPKKQ